MRLPARRRGRPRTRIAVVSVVGVAAAAAVVGLTLRPSEVAVVRPEPRTVVQTVVTSGRVLPPARTPLGVPLAATVAAVHADEGSRVEAGDVLVEVDDAEARAGVAQAEAAVDEARARLGRVHGQGATLALEGLRRARVEAEQAEGDLERAERLQRTGAVPEAELDRARRAAQLARSRVVEARTELADSRPRGTAAQLAAAQLAAAEARLASARARLGETVLRAPAAGTLVERSVEPGAVVQPGQVLLVLVADGPARLVVEPDEVNLARLRVGQHAVASAEAYPDRVFDAELSYIAPAVDPQRGTIEARLRVPDPPDYLRTDMTVSVEIEVGRAEDALALPAVTVADAATDEPWVVVVEDGRAVRRNVSLGLRGDGVVQIAEGLRAGEPVILDPSSVSVGARVRAVDAAQER